MQLLIIRHAIAQDRDEFHSAGARPDHERPLTTRGARRMKANARGIGRIASDVTLLATSPFVRAADTAGIVGRRLKAADIVEVRELVPEAHPRGFIAWLDRHAGAGAFVAAVGHEPQLSRLIAWSTTGRDKPVGELKKGGTCLIVFDGKPRAGGGSIAWILQPRHLRAVGR